MVDSTKPRRERPRTTRVTSAAAERTGNTAPAGTWRRVALLRRTPRVGRGRWYGLAIDLLWAPLMLFTRPVWLGGRHVPASGGVLIASNHVSFVDPIAGTAFVLAHGRIPRYLAKADLWTTPVIGRVLADGRHVPVRRDTVEARHAYDDACDALRRGETVLVYPEGTFTKDPDGWPMRGRTGVARMALVTGVPVVPMAQWGGQRVLPRRSVLPRLFPRKAVHVRVGAPVDVSDFAGCEPTRDVLNAMTARIMAAITELLVEIRGERPA